MMIAKYKIRNLNASTRSICFDYISIYVVEILNNDSLPGIQIASYLFEAMVKNSIQKGRHIGVYIGFNVGIVVFILIILC